MMNKKGLLCGIASVRANATPSTQEALKMRLRVASLRRVVKGDLHPGDVRSGRVNRSRRADVSIREWRVEES
jgi:hypothetical protein